MAIVHAGVSREGGFCIFVVKIYLVINSKNNKVYVGKTVTSVSHRWSRHLYAAKTGIKNHFANALRKYPQSVFSIRQIDKAEEHLDGIYLEKAYIELFQSYKKEFGYNSTFGGEGLVATEEIKKKISRANKGRIFSKAARANMSAAHKGLLGKKSSHYRHDMLNEDILKLYLEGTSILKIAEKYKVHNTTIARRLRRMFKHEKITDVRQILDLKDNIIPDLS